MGVNLEGLVRYLAFDASEGNNLVGNRVGDPRTYGATVGYRF